MQNTVKSVERTEKAKQVHKVQVENRIEMQRQFDEAARMLSCVVEERFGVCGVPLFRLEGHPIDE
jgi:hypothetical protein